MAGLRAPTRTGEGPLGAERRAWISVAGVRPITTGLTPRRVHVASLAAGFVILCVWNRHLWFFQDDWDFLLERGLHHPTLSLWVPHNEHWSTLPILEFRLVVSTFGMKTVWPTLLVLLAAHAVNTHLLWRISVRCAVDRWVATALAAVFLLLGAGHEDLTWDFQIGFVAALTFGLLAMQADRVRLEPRRRMAVVWALLVCALMCSSIGITVTVVAGMDRALRGNLRRAGVTVALPGAVYVVWYVLVGHEGFIGDHFGLSTLLSLPAYVWSGAAGALGSTFGLPGAGPVLLIALLGWSTFRARATVQTRASTAFALGAGSIVLLAIIGLGRSHFGDVQADSSRYVYLTIALLLPLMGVAITDLIGRTAGGLKASRLAVAVLLIILANNAGVLRMAAQQQAAQARGLEVKILAAAAVLDDGDPVLTDTPEPSPEDVNISSSTLLHAERAGQLPREHLTEGELLSAKAIVNVSLSQGRVLPVPLQPAPAVGSPPPAGACLTGTVVKVADPVGGGSIVVEVPAPGALSVSYVAPNGTVGAAHALPLPTGRLVLNLGAAHATAIVTPSDQSISFCR